MHAAQKTRKRRMAPATKAKMALAIGCAAAVAGAGGALAYLTDVDGAVNRFSVVPALQIELVEEQWDAYPDEDGDGVPDAAEEIVPSQTIAKDPAVENTTGTQAWVFLEVSVPTLETSVVEADGSISEAASRELFSYAVNEGWEEMGAASFDDQAQATVHRYAWTTPIDPGSRTGTLFDEVTFANLVDNQLDALAVEGTVSLSIDVDALGIQTEGFGTWQEAWDALAAQTQRA